MRAPAPARSVSVSFLMSISSQWKPHSSQWEAPTANVSTKGTVPTKLALVIDMNRTLDGTLREKMFPIGNVASEPSSSPNSLPFAQILRVPQSLIRPPSLSVLPSRSRRWFGLTFLAARSSAQVVVFDPNNYAQNVLTARSRAAADQQPNHIASAILTVAG